MFVYTSHLGRGGSLGEFVFLPFGWGFEIWMLLNVTSSSSVEVPSNVSFRFLPFRLSYWDWLDCCFPFFFQARCYISQFGRGARLCEFCHSSHLDLGIELEFYGPFRADITSPSLVRFRASVVTFLRMLLSSPSSPTLLKLGRFCNVFCGCWFCFLCLYICFYFSDISDLGIWSETRPLIDPGLSACVPQLFDLVLSSNAASTTHNYSYGWSRWHRWAQPKKGVPLLPAQPLHVALYLLELTEIAEQKNTLVILPLILHFLVFVGVTRWQVWSHRRSTPRLLRL